VALLILSLLTKVKGWVWNEFLQGFIDNSSQFYFLFLAPIMIAYNYRATQEITPTATILATNIVLSNFIDYILTEIIVAVVNHLTNNDSLRRIPPLIALIICFMVIYNPVKKELTKEPIAVVVVDSNHQSTFMSYNN